MAKMAMPPLRAALSHDIQFLGRHTSPGNHGLESFVMALRMRAALGGRSVDADLVVLVAVAARVIGAVVVIPGRLVGVDDENALPGGQGLGLTRMVLIESYSRAAPPGRPTPP